MVRGRGVLLLIRRRSLQGKRERGYKNINENYRQLKHLLTFLEAPP